MEKYRLEELKKMTMDELKAISRPLEVGEIIQEGDWMGICSPQFSQGSIGSTYGDNSFLKGWYRPIETPTDKPADEIKLGWYRNKKVPNEIARFGLLDPDDDDNCLGYWHGTLEPDWFYVPGWEFVGEELPEPGEWVDPGDVKLSELPMRARFRHGNDDWHEGFLDGRLVMKDDSLGYSKHNGGWYSECQVWRPSK